MAKRGPEYDQPLYRCRPLHFSCTQCGACCRGGGDYHVFVDRGEAREICGYLGLSWPWFRRRYLARTDGELVLQSGSDGRCVFLGSDGRCSVYDARPRQCRTYPFWPEVVATERSWRREARRCEGMDRGPRVPVAVIEAALED